MLWSCTTRYLGSKTEQVKEAMWHTLNSSLSPKHKTAVIFQGTSVRKLTTACAAGPKSSTGAKMKSRTGEQKG